jgi:hypothetical protein
MLTADDEIRRLEDHRRVLQDRIGIINTKIASLKSVKES